MQMKTRIYRGACNLSHTLTGPSRLYLIATSSHFGASKNMKQKDANSAQVRLHF